MVSVDVLMYVKKMEQTVIGRANDVCAAGVTRPTCPGAGGAAGGPPRCRGGRSRSPSIARQCSTSKGSRLPESTALVCEP